MVMALSEMPVVSVGDTEVWAIDYTDILDDTETLTGPTATEVTSTDLTIANVAVNSAAVTINGVSVAIGKAVQFKISGQKVDAAYKVLVTVTTTSTPARTIARHAKFRVE
jgi:hypothetical protein